MPRVITSRKTTYTSAEIAALIGVDKEKIDMVTIKNGFGQVCGWEIVVQETVSDITQR